MSAPNEDRTRRRQRQAGLAAALGVALVALVLLTLLPRTTTATASLTVTPRTDAGAGAALLLADRYTALAGAAETLRAARSDTPALSGVPLDQLSEGTSAGRTEGTGTITVRVRLADRDAAVAAANAVVGALVDTGADEDLVEVDRGAEATPSRARTAPDPVRWGLVALLLALAGGLTAAALAGRRSRTAPPAHAVPTGAAGDAAVEPAAEVVDDLPGFLENPPGSVPALPAPAPAVSTPVAAEPARAPGGATAVPASGDGPPATSPRRGAALGTVATVLVLVAGAVLVAVTGGPSDDERAATPAGSAALLGPTGAAAGLTPPTGSAAPGLDPAVPTAAAPASSTDTAAAALAFRSVPLGRDGVAASVAFTGVVLEQRAVGLTVTYPAVSLSTDGRRALAHVRLPTYNCLTAEPPPDPAVAGCAPSLTEYADLASPQLQISRDGDRVDLVGLFPTYTRSNGSAPAYTGRAYQLTASITADGAAGDGLSPATGVVRIGPDTAPTTADPGVNVLQLPR